MPRCYLCKLSHFNKVEMEKRTEFFLEHESLKFVLWNGAQSRCVSSGIEVYDFVQNTRAYIIYCILYPFNI